MNPLIQFLKDYRAMRKAQSEYFRSPSKLRLQKAKALELNLDARAA